MDVPGLEFEARPPSQYAFDFPDSECEGWSTDRLTLRFASVRGAKHRYYRQPRQDAARAAVHEATGSIVFAVADGVSSAAESHQGAVEACRAAVERILHLLDRSPDRLDGADVAAQAAERLRELARWRLGVAAPQAAEVARLYATTLVAGAVRAAGDALEVELFRIGDSAAWLLDRAAAATTRCSAARPYRARRWSATRSPRFPWSPTGRRRPSDGWPNRGCYWSARTGSAIRSARATAGSGSCSPVNSPRRRHRCGSVTCWTSPGRPSTTTAPCWRSGPGPRDTGERGA
ncbi:protein phosphatase 2C domain-containing protein [Kitasatospora arboriphila]